MIPSPSKKKEKDSELHVKKKRKKNFIPLIMRNLIKWFVLDRLPCIPSRQYRGKARRGEAGRGEAVYGSSANKNSPSSIIKFHGGGGGLMRQI